MSFTRISIMVVLAAVVVYFGLTYLLPHQKEEGAKNTGPTSDQVFGAKTSTTAPAAPDTAAVAAAADTPAASATDAAPKEAAPTQASSDTSAASSDAKGTTPAAVAAAASESQDSSAPAAASTSEAAAASSTGSESASSTASSTTEPAAAEQLAASSAPADTTSSPAPTETAAASSDTSAAPASSNTLTASPPRKHHAKHASSSSESVASRSTPHVEQAPKADVATAWWPEASKQSADHLNLVYAGEAGFERAVVLLFSSDLSDAAAAGSHVHIYTYTGKTVDGTWALGKNPRMLVLPVSDPGRYTVVIDPAVTDSQSKTLSGQLFGPVYVH